MTVGGSTSSSANDEVLLAYFFVPLPDPLGLPNGYIYTVYQPESYESWVERHLSDDSPPGEYVVASMRFWRVADEWSAGRAVAQAIRLALPAGATKTDDSVGIEIEATVVELVVRVDSESEEALSDAFDDGLLLLRDFQRAYHLLRKRPLQLVTRQRLPLGVPFGVRRGESPDAPFPDDLSLMLMHANVPWRDPDLTEVEIEGLERAVQLQSEAAVFTPYVDLRREAEEALSRNGDSRAAVLFAASAAEVLLNNLLAHMLWEEAMRPEVAATLFDAATLLARLRRDYHPRLGGSGWDLSPGTALGDWHSHLAALRHRVIHAGYEPTYEEARRALDALWRLDSYLADTFAKPKPRSTYPRTALALMGKPGLEKRSAWTRRFERLVTDDSEPNWLVTFGRWNAAMQRSRAERPAWAVQPDPSKSFMLAVVHPGGPVSWVLHDRRAGMAAVAESPVLPQEMAANVSTLIRTLSESGSIEPLSIALLEVGGHLAREATWLPEYRLVPMAGVMIDQQDLDPPSPIEGENGHAS
jgi:hypothetical protein